MTDCTVWPGCKDSKGYGRRHYQGTNKLAHRVAWYEAYGEWPDCLDHLCRNRACVNVHHLEPVSRAENTRRGVSANRSKTHCPQGHEYTPENTGRSGNYRWCRICKRASWREWKARQSG